MGYLKVGAVAARLGVSEQAVRLWCRTGVLPAYRPAGTRQWLVDPERFEAWLQTRATEEVLDSLGAPYRDDRPDHELLADSVALGRPEPAAPHEPASSATPAPSRRGWEARPVAIPGDVDSPGVEKASGHVRLPLRVRWCGPEREYDLRDPADRRSVYRQVLTEGTEDDVRRYIDVDELIAMWPTLHLSPHVRRAWAAWLRQSRGLDLAC